MGGSTAIVSKEWSGFFRSFSLVILGLNEVATLEAIVCREGLSLVKDLGLQSFIIISDVKQMVSDIEKNI